MEFDVASVRESHPNLSEGIDVGGGLDKSSGLLRLTNMNLENLLEEAFSVNSPQIEGVPRSFDRSMYNVDAKLDESNLKELASLDPRQLGLEQQHMLQILLAQRFHLKTHWSTEEGPVYDLVVSKAGVRMKLGGSIPPSPKDVVDSGQRPIPSIYQRGDGKRGYELIGHNCHMGSFADLLGALMDRPVQDKTGLTGGYDFDFQYSDESEAAREQDPALWPPIPDAAEDQLGLKLEHAKGPIRKLVVDHVERPSEN